MSKTFTRFATTITVVVLALTALVFPAVPRRAGAGWQP